jgi:hypothetical protein
MDANVGLRPGLRGAIVATLRLVTIVTSLVQHHPRFFSQIPLDADDNNALKLYPDSSRHPINQPEFWFTLLQDIQWEYGCHQVSVKKVGFSVNFNSFSVAQSPLTDHLATALLPGGILCQVKGP